eukprot:834853_1
MKHLLCHWNISGRRARGISITSGVSTIYATNDRHDGYHDQGRQESSDHVLSPDGYIDTQFRWNTTTRIQKKKRNVLRIIAIEVDCNTNDIRDTTIIKEQDQCDDP